MTRPTIANEISACEPIATLAHGHHRHRVGRAERVGRREPDVQVVDELRSPAGRRQVGTGLLWEGQVRIPGHAVGACGRPSPVEPPVQERERDVVAEPDLGAGDEQRHRLVGDLRVCEQGVDQDRRRSERAGEQDRDERDRRPAQPRRLRDRCALGRRTGSPSRSTPSVPASSHGGKIASCDDEARAKTIRTMTAIVIGQRDSPLMTWPVSGSTVPSPSSGGVAGASALTMLRRRRPRRRVPAYSRSPGRCGWRSGWPGR